MEEILHNITDTFEMSENEVFFPDNHRAKNHPLKQVKNFLFCLRNNIYIFICKKMYISAYMCTCMCTYIYIYYFLLHFFAVPHHNTETYDNCITLHFQ